MARRMRAALAVLLLAALAACSAGAGEHAGDDAVRSTTAESAPQPAAVAAAGVVEEAPAAPDVLAAPARGEADADGGAPGPVPFQQVDPGRSIVYVGSMLVEVVDVRRATQEARAAIAGLGGLVFGEHTTSEPLARTELTFKVLPEDFTEAMRRLGALGDLKSQQISADDVTERVVDLESRIITARASVERLRSFLASATDLEAVAELEPQLLSRETDLERLRGQLRTIEDRIALATIFLTLTEPAPDLPEAQVEFAQTGYAGDDDGQRCPAADELAVDEPEPVTICVSAENTGNVALVGIEIRDFGLDLDDDDFVALDGSAAGPLGPGERLLGYFRTEAAVDRWPEPAFYAVAVDADGEPLRIPVSVDYDVLEYRVAPDDSLPTFADGLRASWGAVVTLARLGVLAVGVAIPFLWVVPLALGLLWLVRRLRRPERPAAPAGPARDAAEAGGETGPPDR